MSEENLTLEELYNQSIKIIKEGQIVKGKIVAVKQKEVIVDVGFKSEGIVAIAEFAKDDLEVGKEVDFLIESIDPLSSRIIKL